MHVSTIGLVRHVRTNWKSNPVGESNGRCVHADVVVDRARALHAAGVARNEIARQLRVPRATVFDWLNLRSRRGHARVIVKRARRHQTEHQSVRAQRADATPARNVGTAVGLPEDQT